jgi:spore germination protein YaaH
MKSIQYSAFVLFLCLISGCTFAYAQMSLQGMSLPQHSIVDSGTEIHVSAWVPYWRKEGGTQEAQEAMLYIDTFSPFMYEVAKDGTISPKADLKEGTWASLLYTARLSNKKITPTIIWLKGEEIHAVLQDPKKRKKHIEQLVSIVRTGTRYSDGGFDGIDIDYEGKKWETRAAYSAFIRELKTELRKYDKLLVCTIETRNANTTFETQVAKEKAGDYVNEYAVLGKECDIVRVMSYDQRNADVVLNKQNEKELYMPVSDIAWVKKVYTTLIRHIDPKKIEMGIPTYGHAYKITPKTGGGWNYERMRSLTYVQAMERKNLYKSTTPVRGISGELIFTYTIETGEFKGTYLAVVSDAYSVRQKIELAERLGLRGVALFALYGTNDPQLKHNL